MRIAYVCADPGVPVFGRKGCSIHVQEMLRALLRRGATIDLFAARPGGESSAEMACVRIHELQGFQHPADPHDMEPLHRANAGLRRALERGGPYDLVYERYSLWSHAAMQYARSAGVPGVLEVNAPLIEEQARYRKLHAPEVAHRIAARVFGDAAVLSAVSSQVADYLRRFPSARGRIHVIHNGVDSDRFSQIAVSDAATGPGRLMDDRPADFAIGRRVFTVGFVGSLKPWHGLSTLVEAFARLYRIHPDIRLLIVGDGPERENIIAQLAAEGSDVLAAVDMTGVVPPSDVPAWLSRMDVAAAPYPVFSDFYFSPLKIFEYMAAGLPVISSRVGDLPGIVRDGVNGILCAPGDAVALAAALDRLRGDPALCRRLGQSARVTVLRRHTWDEVAHRILLLAGIATGSPSVAVGNCRRSNVGSETSAHSLS